MATLFKVSVVDIEQNAADHGKKRYTLVVEYASSISTDLDNEITEGDDLNIEIPSTSPPV